MDSIENQGRNNEIIYVFKTTDLHIKCQPDCKALYQCVSPTLQTSWKESWRIKVVLRTRCSEDSTVKSKLSFYLLNETKPISLPTHCSYRFTMNAVIGLPEFEKDLLIYRGSKRNFKYVDTTYEWGKFELIKFRLKIKFATHHVRCTSIKTFQDRLYKAKENEALSDFTICVGDERIKANKIVLAVVSPVFAAMFNNDCVERNSGILEMHDADVQTVNRFLDYAYTGSIPLDIDVESALKLYCMADKYQVDVLKELCYKFVGSKMCDPNVFSQVVTFQRPICI